MLPAGKSTGRHLRVKQKMPLRGTCGANRMESTPLTRLLKPIMNNGVTIGPSYSTRVLTKWSIARSSTSSWPLHGQFVLLPMQGWNWPVLEMFRILGTCLSHHTRITAMHVCDSRFDQTLAWRQIFSQFCQCQLCNEVQEWGPSYSAILAESGPDLWRKGRVQHSLVIWRFTIYRCGWNVAA